MTAAIVFQLHTPRWVKTSISVSDVMCTRRATIDRATLRTDWVAYKLRTAEKPAKLYLPAATVYKGSDKSLV